MGKVDLHCSFFYEVKYKETVNLKDFTEALRGIENEYFRYCNRLARGKKKYEKYLLKEDRILDIKKISQSSIIVELCNTVMPVIADINNLLTFAMTLKSIYDIFLGDKIPTLKDLLEKNITKKTLQNAQKIVLPAAENKDIRLNFFVVGNNNTINVGSFDNAQASAISQKMNLASSLLEDTSEDNDTYTKVYMYWDTTSFNSDKVAQHKQTGKVIIQDIDKKPHSVVFQNNEDYEFCTAKNDRFESDWQYLLYRVDVKIIKVGTRIHAYDIIRTYPDDIIEREDT